MNGERLERILQAMQEKKIPQLLISDEVVVKYLTGLTIHSGERLLAILLKADGNHRIYINELFPQQQDPGMEIVWYNDNQDAVEILSRSVEDGQPIAIDKNWPARFLLRLQELKGNCRYRNSSCIIDYVRMIKGADEQEKMILSSRINDRVIGRVIPLVGQGYDELELNAMVRSIYAEEGCEGVSFDPITAFEKNAADPHHEADHSKGKPGDCVVIDIGGMKDGYASDMTRTVFLDHVSERQKEIYRIVRDANLKGIAAAKPGNRMCDVDLAARNYIEEKGFGKYFTHRTGHSIGIEDHEYGDVSSVNTDIIKPGQCFSVEPGIYIQEEGIGVRVEDLVLITEDGCRVLNGFTKNILVVKEDGSVEDCGE